LDLDGLVIFDDKIPLASEIVPGSPLILVIPLADKHAIAK